MTLVVSEGRWLSINSPGAGPVQLGRLFLARYHEAQETLTAARLCLTGIGRGRYSLHENYAVVDYESGGRSNNMLTWNIGLASWIIQDGNYPDFSLGDQRRFALEFSATSLSPSLSKKEYVEHVS